MQCLEEAQDFRTRQTTGSEITLAKVVKISMRLLGSGTADVRPLAPEPDNEKKL